MDIAKNKQIWEKEWDWTRRGEEWSAPWGSSDVQWHWTIRPRLMNLLPTHSVVEIAPGYGRWSKYLLPQCRKYVGIDLSETCIEGCREIFSSQQHAEFRLTDGSTLSGVPDNSVDLVFSFDSLVHVEKDELLAYLSESARALKLGGYAFIHHSNLADQPNASDSAHLRAPSVCAEQVRDYCDNHQDLMVVVQEKLPVGGKMIDAISLIRKNQKPTPMNAIENKQYSAEIDYARHIGALWTIEKDSSG